MGDFLQQTAGPWTMYQVSIGFVLAAFGFVARLVLTYRGQPPAGEVHGAHRVARRRPGASRPSSGPLGTILPLAGVFLGVRYLVSLQPEWTWLAQGRPRVPHRQHPAGDLDGVPPGRRRRHCC